MPPPSISERSSTSNTAAVSTVWLGIMAAAVCWFVAYDLGTLDLFPLWRGEMATVFVAIALGTLVSFRSARLMMLLGTGSLLLWLVVAFTPLAAVCVRGLQVSQSATKADAVVVLLASIQQDDDFAHPSLERTLHGLSLMQQNYAPRLILTQGFSPQGSHRTAALRLMKELKMGHQIEMVGPVRDTHDEAVQVSRLAASKGWKRILLVTSPLHSRRSFLVFAKTGLQVVSTPCRETSFNLENINSPGARIEAFNSAIHEIIGLRVYRARGWV